MRYASFRLVKLAISSAFLVLLYLTWLLLSGHLDWELALGSAALSGFWLVLTGTRLRQLFTTYFDNFSRLQVLVPLLLGVTLAVVCMVAVQHWLLYTIAVLELIGWGAIYIGYRINRKHYIQQGHGPLPAGAWVNPPSEAWQPFDIGLYGGRMAARLRESVGHGEITLRLPDGRLMSFSSFMELGTVFQDLATVTSKQLSKGHYIVVRLQHPITDELINRAYLLAEQMYRDNAEWKKASFARRVWLINCLPLPVAYRQRLIKRFQVTGYDWLGLIVGARASNRWTCVGACITLLERLGVKTNKYGTGLLGLGTGLFNPIMPVRFLADPAFRLLTQEDKELWENSGEKRQ